MPPLEGEERKAADATERIVVLFMQNNSFNKLFGLWGDVEGEDVDGIANATKASLTQVNQDGKPISCALMNDVNLAPGQLAGPAPCKDKTGVKADLYAAYQSPYDMAPFLLDEPLPAGAVTCPFPGTEIDNGTPANSSGAQAGGCSRDLVHRFYQEQYQLNDGKQNRYAVGSDAAGLVMGHYDTRQMQVYKYLTGDDAPKYAVADRFFGGVFGGSYANGQWLISATLPEWTEAPDAMYSVLDENGMPASQTPADGTTLGEYNYYLSPQADTVHDGQLTQKCNTIPDPDLLCGAYTVNTTYGVQWPYAPWSKPEQRIPLFTHDNIGSRLNDAGIDWAWYSGGWANANGYQDMPGWTNGDKPITRAYFDSGNGEELSNPSGCPDVTADPSATWPQCPDADFQYHHQSFNYFYDWSESTPETSANREANLRDIAEWFPLTEGDACQLKPVSFVQEIGETNQHPGYASAYVGDEQIASVLKAIYGGPCAKGTLTIVTYDEFGGAWDHVPPPGQGAQTPGASDKFGPGTRIPSLIVSSELPRSGVDSTTYDLASVISTITSKYDLEPINSRDAQQAPVWKAWSELASG